MLNRKMGEVMLRRLGQGDVGEAPICKAPCGFVTHCPFNPNRVKGMSGECTHDPTFCVEQWIDRDYQGAVAAFLGEHVKPDDEKVSPWASESEAIAAHASAIIAVVIDALEVPEEHQAEIHGKVRATGFEIVNLLGKLLAET